MNDRNKFQLQNNLYEFPYHYIPHFTAGGIPSLMRKRAGGLQYLCYQNHLRQKVLSMNPESVLEVGCGEGYFIGHLPSSIPVRVGVDLSSKAIAFAKAFNPDCIFYEQDASVLEDQFDIVIAIEVLEHIPEEGLPSFLNVLYERAKRDGRVIISVPALPMPVNRKHYRHYTKELLETHLVQSGVNLKIVEHENVFSKPWWYGILKSFIDNRLFSLEVKPLMRLAWKQVWNKYRIATAKNGCHLIAVLKKNNINESQ
jgi:SAM-dependent methyltransferase